MACLRLPDSLAELPRLRRVLYSWFQIILANGCRLTLVPGYFSKWMQINIAKWKRHMG